MLRPYYTGQPSAGGPIGRLCLRHEARPVRHRWHAPVDRRRRPPRHSARPPRRSRYGGPHRDLPVRREDRSADRAGSPVARGTRGRGQRERDPGGVSPLCGSPSHRAGATDSNDAADGGDRRPARGARDPGRHGGRARRHLRVSRLSASPADELEVKARVDDPEGLRAALLGAGASLDFRGDMTDRRFDRDRTLGERGEVLRLREFRPADGAPAYGVLGWKGPASQRGMYRHRAEAEARVAAPDSVVTILEQLGFAVSLRIDRHVEVYRLGRAVLRLEWYPAMDVLLEVEGEPPDIELAIAATGLARERFLPESLPYFVAQYEARTGRAALLAR